MSRQSCVYCVHMTVGDANWCDMHKRTYSDNTIRCANGCEWFEFCEINAANPNVRYKPRAIKSVEQMRLDIA